MNLKHLLAATAASTLLLTACNQDDSAETEEPIENAETEEAKEAEATEVKVSEDELKDSIEFDGEYGHYVITRIDTIDIPPTDLDKEAAEDAGEEASDSPAVVIEFDFTNKSNSPTSASEAFALDLAVRQFNESGMIPTDNLTLDIPEDSTYHKNVNDASETVQTDESSKAVVAYGPIDSEENDINIQSREDESLLNLLLKFNE
ncbi:DUF5067 domain-containing protein [Nosocomiicoccus ampullae]|uniref:DUF5067 domain-containing protein n=1 Tax=Nosocomiicoccus ampullae TaxID=489910 RepID=A0A9Q2CYG5_9STAP|nr:DUF5067 domain-containing protein [Nosocomiicoccus ampullae]MBB5175202.1 hypothetical protein [Nosocomiicoccus ampullae]QYA46420.1 DUF5067 domain-containing protein [Nosocomiicoccus ampullae]QYA47928.1 DUF5067 domain-containing protein [Nosocomiicoccus ampullae]